MRIENEPKLDFKDVLIRPKRSTLGSRAEVEIERAFRFAHTGREWRGFPMIAANMDVVGTIPMAARARHVQRSALVRSTKHLSRYIKTLLVRFFLASGERRSARPFIPSGTAEADWESFARVKRPRDRSAMILLGRRQRAIPRNSSSMDRAGAG